MANPFDQFDEGNPFDQFDKEQEQDNKALSGLKGIGETAIGLTAPIVSTMWGGLRGLGDIVSGQGIEQANKTFESVRDRNFGLGLPTPQTETGKNYLEKVQKGTEYLTHKVGGSTAMIGKALGNEEAGRSIGEASAEALLNFLPVKLGLGVRGSLAKGKIGKAPAKGRIEALEADIKKPEVAPNPFDQFDSQMELPLENSPQQVAEMQARAQGQRDLFAPTNEPLNSIVPEVSPEVPRSPIETEAQHRLFDQSEDVRMRNPYEAVTGDWRVDENGIPIKADLSMEVQNLENVLQRNLWGDELPPKTSQEAVPLTQAIDSMPDLPWKSERDVGIDSLKGEIPVDPDMAVANIEANGPRIPQSQRGAIDLEAFRRKKDEDQLKRMLPEVYEDFTPQIPGLEVTELDSYPRPNLSKVPWSQRGAIDLSNGTEPKGHPLTTMAPDPTLRKQFLASKIVGLKGYGGVKTPEQALALAKGAKDIGRFQRVRAQSVSPGINAVAINSNNPLVMFARDTTRRVFQETEQLARQYITGDRGLKTNLQKMSQQEKNEVIAALQKGDENLTEISPEVLRKNGFNENQIEFIQKVYEMERVKLDVWNKARAAVGMTPVTARPGHWPGVFRGDYKQIVFGKNPDGSKKVIGVIAVDSVYQMKKAQKKISELYGKDVSYSEIDRRKLGGNGQKSDAFSGMADVVELLSKNNPEFAKIQEIVGSAIKEKADAVFGANVHSLAKKGVFGNEGNKPWLDQDKNTNDSIKAYLRYWEEGILSHKNLESERNLKALMDNPEFDHMPNAKKYVDDYIKNMTGRSLDTLGGGLNAILDAPFKFTGFGPSVPRELINQLNKRAGQWTMGFGNYLFSAVQFLQVPQMALPEMIKLSKMAGLNSVIDPQVALAKTTSQIKGLIEEALDGKSNLDPLMKGAVKEAEARGMLEFSEFQDVNKVSQGKISRTFDKVADLNRELPEKGTRPFVFYSMVNMLRDSGLKPAEIYEVAYNATQKSMVDYSMRERPMMYQKLGIGGQLSGSLQTFKHAQLSQMADFVKEAGKGNVAPLIAAAVAMATFAGVKGTAGYQDADQLVQYLTGKLSDDNERQSIEDIMLKNWPEWAKSGVLSTSTDMNFQSRLSAGNIVPDSPIEAVSPFAGMMGRQVGSLYDLATKQDPLAAKQAAIQFTPSGPLKGIAEAMLATDKDGYAIDKRGEKGNTRSDWDRRVRLATGGTSLTEALRSEHQYQDIQQQALNQETQKKIIEEVKRLHIQGLLNEANGAELARKYVKAKGDPEQLVNQLVQYAEGDAVLPKEKRLQGIDPSSLSSVNKYLNYKND